MPRMLVRQYCDQALSGELSEGMKAAWRSGLLHAGDKEKTDSKGRQRARPLVVGLAIRRICGRLPCAQFKKHFSGMFVKLRQLGALRG